MLDGYQRDGPHESHVRQVFQPENGHRREDKIALLKPDRGSRPLQRLRICWSRNGNGDGNRGVLVIAADAKSLSQLLLRKPCAGLLFPCSGILLIERRQLRRELGCGVTTRRPRWKQAGACGKAGKRRLPWGCACREHPEEKGANPCVGLAPPGTYPFHKGTSCARITGE